MHKTKVTGSLNISSYPKDEVVKDIINNVIKSKVWSAKSTLQKMVHTLITYSSFSNWYVDSTGLEVH